MSKKIQVLADPTLVNFFEMHFKKNYKFRISQHLESFDSIISMAGFTLKFGNLLVQGQELP